MILDFGYISNDRTTTGTSESFVDDANSRSIVHRSKKWVEKLESGFTKPSMRISRIDSGSHLVMDSV